MGARAGGGHRARERSAHLTFCTLAILFSLTPCFSWGLVDALTCQPFQRLSAGDKPLKRLPAYGQRRPPR